MVPNGRHLYSSKWAVALLGAAFLLIIFVGMIRELSERWRVLDGG